MQNFLPDEAFNFHLLLLALGLQLWWQTWQFLLVLSRLKSQPSDFNRKFSNSRNRWRWLFQPVEIAPLRDIAAWNRLCKWAFTEFFCGQLGSSVNFAALTSAAKWLHSSSANAHPSNLLREKFLPHFQFLTIKNYRSFKKIYILVFNQLAELEKNGPVRKRSNVKRPYSKISNVRSP